MPCRYQEHPIQMLEEYELRGWANLYPSAEASLDPILGKRELRAIRV
eukprot:CAMPEP_0206486892 /NCGR_PEP_ID=MMETSP0324_2-20121206/41295_1 /ASSEMBLY_ACC=CAM_ASM_000836 /TAXON_ID=2866 /ORGANISM="Crypthecodinium cohnii, Strain Seligo" /LENGTH=46 /DNA_ID= /DNA_START= /DNA_END= /DNA_ORIENTATION=